MEHHYFIGGVRFRRRRLIKLDRAERAELAATGHVVLSRPVEWPLEGRSPHFERAIVDPGGTYIWGPGPYLKVPNSGAEEEVVNRIFCPWGYPQDRLRIERSPNYVRLVDVALDRADSCAWDWLLKIEPWRSGQRGLHSKRRLRRVGTSANHRDRKSVT